MPLLVQYAFPILSASTLKQYSDSFLRSSIRPISVAPVLFSPSTQRKLLDYLGPVNHSKVAVRGNLLVKQETLDQTVRKITKIYSCRIVYTHEQ